MSISEEALSGKLMVLARIHDLRKLVHGLNIPACRPGISKMAKMRSAEISINEDSKYMRKCHVIHPQYPSTTLS